ncbi:hypothetical protein FVE85_0348 [Porphyridium purpureum]|uniref:Uncharacterized protein n=1 Tax=Porphyridium purpureum TaxID=35688 RepID=A0A5J4YYD2_PORPP|nr:hypothetical protein FVE85_0348 [Porphyridium purpureum]|eukprot:POR2921..scf208_2
MGNILYRVFKRYRLRYHVRAKLDEVKELVRTTYENFEVVPSFGISSGEHAAPGSRESVNQPKPGLQRDASNKRAGDGTGKEHMGPATALRSCTVSVLLDTGEFLAHEKKDVEANRIPLKLAARNVLLVRQAARQVAQEMGLDWGSSGFIHVRGLDAIVSVYEVGHHSLILHLRVSRAHEAYHDRILASVDAALGVKGSHMFTLEKRETCILNDLKELLSEYDRYFFTRLS